ncbi:unnamed protein product [Closterium sp. NIES-65]|nr:unnamed protein product [Closterium sp. NIES-65]
MATQASLKLNPSSFASSICESCSKPRDMSHPWHHPPLFNDSARSDLGLCRFVCTAPPQPPKSPASDCSRDAAALHGGEAANGSISSGSAGRYARAVPLKKRDAAFLQELFVREEMAAQRERRTRIRELVVSDPEALSPLTDPVPAGCPVARGFFPQTAVLAGCARDDLLGVEVRTNVPLEAIDIGLESHNRRIGDVYSVLPLFAIPMGGTNGPGSDLGNDETLAAPLGIRRKAWADDDDESEGEDDAHSTRSLPLKSGGGGKWGGRKQMGGAESEAEGGIAKGDSRARAQQWRVAVVAADDHMAADPALLRDWFSVCGNTRALSAYLQKAGRRGSPLRLRGMTIGPQERDATRNLVSSAHFSWMLQYAIDYAICRCAAAADSPLDVCHVAEAARVPETAEMGKGTARRSAAGDEQESAAAGITGFAEHRGAIPASVSGRSAATTGTSARNSLSSAPEAGGLIAAEDFPQRSANLSDNIPLCDSQYDSDRSGPLDSARDDAGSSRAKSYRRSSTLGATDLHRIISATGSRRLRGNTGSDKERSGSGMERADRDRVKEGMAEHDAGKGNRKRTACTGGGSGSALSGSKTSSSECVSATRVGGWNQNFESGGGTKKTDIDESGLKSRVAGGTAAARMDGGLGGAEAGKGVFQNVQQPQQQQQKKDGDGKVNVIVEGGVAPEDIFGFLRDSRLTATVAKEGPFGAPQKPFCSNTAAQTPQALQAPQAAPQAAQAAQAPPASQPPQEPQALQDPPDLFDFLRDPRLKATMPKGAGAWITTAAAGAAGAAVAAAAAPAGAAADAPLSFGSSLQTNLHLDVSGEGAASVGQESAERVSPLERNGRGSRQHQESQILSNPVWRRASAFTVSAASAPTSPRAATKPALLFQSLTPPTHLSASLGKGGQEGGEGMREGVLWAEGERKVREHVESGFFQGMQQVQSGEQQQQQQGRKKGMARCLSMGLPKFASSVPPISRRNTSERLTNAAAAVSGSSVSYLAATASDRPAADDAGASFTAAGAPALAAPPPAPAAAAAAAAVGTGAGSATAGHISPTGPSAPQELQMRPLAAHMRAASFSSQSSLSMRESPFTTTLAARAGATNSRDPKRALGKSSSYETGSAVSSRVVRMPFGSPSAHSAVGAGVFQKFTHDGLMTPCEDSCMEEDVSPPPLQPSPFLAAIISSSQASSSSSLSRSLSSLKPPAPSLTSASPSWQLEQSSCKLSRSQSSNSVAAAALVSPSPRLLMRSPSALSARRKAPAAAIRLLLTHPPPPSAPNLLSHPPPFLSPLKTPLARCPLRSPLPPLVAHLVLPPQFPSRPHFSRPSPAFSPSPPFPPSPGTSGASGAAVTSSVALEEELRAQGEGGEAMAQGEGGEAMAQT